MADRTSFTDPQTETPEGDIVTKPTTNTINALKTSNPASDNEGGEKPVREQLKKTSIDATSNGQTIGSSGITKAIAASGETEQETAMDTSEGTTLRRKRSRDDDDDDEDAKDEEISKGSGRHTRKRSRDGDAESPGLVSSDSAEDSKMDSEINGSAVARSGTPPTASMGDDALSGDLISPKGKRTRAQFQRDDEDQTISSVTQKSTAIPSNETESIKLKSGHEVEERGAKRPREIGEEEAGTDALDKESKQQAQTVCG
jgi:Ran-binding protein 3